MSPQTQLLAAGLAAASISWAASRCDARPETPSSPTPAPSPSPSGPPTVILLSSGKILQGELSEGDAGYILKQKLGPIPLAKRDVEGSFHSLREVYAYKRDRLAQGDPDEHMKLAQWCLSQGLKPEAKEQLAAVLALVEDHPTATAMIAKLDASAERSARTDPDIVRSSVDVVTPDRPDEIDPALLRGARRNVALGSPVVFDLPPPLAARRFQEFATFVHPELQRRCASCHHEQSDRKFQLLQGKTARAQADGLLQRTNLDAVLKFVDPRNPAKSELLVNAAMPHGGAKQAIYSGPNQPGYRILATWVNALRTAAKGPEVASDPVGGAEQTAATPPVGGGFGSDRPVAPGPTPKAAADPAMASSPTPDATHPGVPADVDFRTISPVMGAGPDVAKIKPQAKDALPAMPGVPPEALKPLTAKDLDKLDRKSKPKAIDPALLEKMMQGRKPNP